MSIDAVVEEVVEELEAAPTAPLVEWRKLAIFFVMAVGQFMALLDIQIVVASLSSIQGGLSASQDEIDWIQTAYLMAEIVMIPLSAYLAQALSTRWVFVGSAALFTVTSLACGAAWDLPSMVVFRAIQGFVGGAMIPLAFATGFSFFDGAKAAMATAVLGVISTLAPTLGPAIGGWITDTLGWRWLFFVNIAPGAAVAIALLLLGRYERAQPRLLLHIDWLHAASLALSLGGLQYVLEEGPQHQWLSDPYVAATTWVTVVATLVFFERCFFSPNPLVSLRPMRHQGFFAASVLSLVVGFCIFTSVFLTPIFLARVRDFSSLDIGGTVFVSGAFMALSAGPAAWLAARIDLRLLMAIGLVLYVISFWQMTTLGSEWGFWQLFLPQAVRGAAVLFTMVSVVGMAMRELPEEEVREASGLNNLMRNLGGAVGIALVNTWLLSFAMQHGAALVRALGQTPDQTMAAIYSIGRLYAGAGIDPATAGRMATETLMSGVTDQALTLAFDDVFAISAWLAGLSLLIVPFCRAGPLTQGPRNAMH
ncbi:MAG TPA: DHA2 family efflux MFS transporter permease subunit [Caulobacteraceae bacterium]|nr:DHA2 family efflux MFS transporter permease subunit [Caulobacteraceae bacterium]